MKIQKWMDDTILDPDETPPSLEDRKPWWESVVARLCETEGTLCLT
jgi:hypothetical protein